MRSSCALAAQHLVRVGVQPQVADGDRRLAARRAAAQQRAQARQQLLALERLDEVVVGAGVETLDARLDGVAGGEYQDRHVVALAQRLGDLDAVELRQAEVEDHQIGQEGVRLVERGHAVAGDADVVALHAQRALQDLGDRVVVLDDEDAGGALEIGSGAHCDPDLKRVSPGNVRLFETL